MIDDPSPLEHMGTPSQETITVEAAIARQAAGMGQAPDRSTEKPVDTLDAATGSGADAGSRVGAAANWAVDKAKDAAHAAAHQVPQAGNHGGRELYERRSHQSDSSSPPERERC
jgi:hypothetical protein